MTTVMPSQSTSPAPRSRASTARSALGLLREQAWIGALLGVIVISIVFVFLGRWQYHRHLSRAARNNLVNSNYYSAPVPLAELLPAVGQNPTATLPKHLQWRQVRVSGIYLTDDTVLLRNRPQPSDVVDDGTGSQTSENGYEVEVPLRMTDGLVLLVDRGWIPAGSDSAARPDSVPAPPEGTIQVTVRMRPSEPPTNRKAPVGQSNRLDTARLGADLGTPYAEHVVGPYGQLVSESPAASNTPTMITKPDPGFGINMAYAVQWVAFAIAAYVMLGVSMVREVRRRDQASAAGLPDRARRPTPPLDRRYG